MSQLYDQFHRPIPGSGAERPETRRLSVASLPDRWSTYPSNGLTPQRLAAILRQADSGDVYRQNELFEEMEEKDPHLASQFQIRKMAVQGLGWEVIPEEESAPARETAQFCRSFLQNLTDFDEHILDMLDAIAKGYSMMEILWDVSGGEVGIRDLGWVPPRKITFSESLTPRVLTDDEPVRGIDPPPFKFVYHRYKARSGYDTRAGIMRVCSWMYLFKNYAVKDWIGFAEVYGMPLRVGKYEPGASKADREALIHAVRSLGSDAAGIISKATEIEFIEAQKGASLDVYESLTSFCDAQMSKAILGQTLTSEPGSGKGHGSYALGRVHAEVRQDLVRADCKSLAKTITQQILRPLVGFNFGWDAPLPRFQFQCEPPEDLRAVAEVYRILSEIGFGFAPEQIAERFRLPAPARRSEERPGTGGAGSAKEEDAKE